MAPGGPWDTSARQPRWISTPGGPTIRPGACGVLEGDDEEDEDGRGWCLRAGVMPSDAFSAPSKPKGQVWTRTRACELAFRGVGVAGFEPTVTSSRTRLLLVVYYRADAVDTAYLDVRFGEHGLVVAVVGRHVPCSFPPGRSIKLDRFLVSGSLSPGCCCQIGLSRLNIIQKSLQNE